MAAQEFTNIVLKDRLTVAPEHLNANINNYILRSLKSIFEGKCSKHGYIKPGSINLVSKTYGTIVSSFLNGTVSYDVTFSAYVCNPQIGSVIKAVVVNSNMFGVLAEYGIPINGIMVPMIEIIIAKKNTDIDISIGQEINVEVVGKKFELNDTKIIVVGKYIKDPTIVKTNKNTGGVDDEDEEDDDGGEEESGDIKSESEEGEESEHETEEEEEEEDEDDEEEDDDLESNCDDVDGSDCASVSSDS